MTRPESRELPGHDLDIDGRQVTVRVRRSQRARQARVSVAPGELVEVVIPRRTPRRQVALILAEKEGWIRRQLERLDALEQREDQLGLRQPGFVWLHREPVPIEIRPIDAGASAGWTARLKAGTLVIRGPRDTAQPSGAREAAVLRWYRREARHRISQVVEREAECLGVTPGGLAIRDPRTRWGSCSSRATLSFSWRLLLAPCDVLDYVVVHELCHLRELNHSASFWRHVARARPGYRGQVEWLRHYGRELHEYQPMLTEDHGTVVVTSHPPGSASSG